MLLTGLMILRGLKAVTKHKLGYDPVEISPEDMLPYAREKPQVRIPVFLWFCVQSFNLLI